MYCFPEGEFLQKDKEKFACSVRAFPFTYIITEDVGFFVNVPLLRLQLVIIIKSLNKKIHRSFFKPDGD